MLPSDLERRAAQEVRASGRKLTGYVARFDNEARIGTFTEVIRRGAFRASLDSGVDILALADHDPKAVLGRTRSGTLELREDSDGLAFTLSLPDTQAGRDLTALAERGDLGGCSFGFTVPAGGERWDGSKRELRAVNLAEVSIVSAWPAYANTEVNLRSRQPASQLAALRRWLETCR
jgi:HK97 family phage prohead protease